MFFPIFIPGFSMYLFVKYETKIVIGTNKANSTKKALHLPKLSMYGPKEMRKIKIISW